MRVKASVVVFVVLIGGVMAFATPARAAECRTPTIGQAATPADIQAFFRKQKKTVVTFMGYSGAEYEDKAGMLKRAGGILDALDPKRTIVNIGATAEGVGAVYELAKQKGFDTTGIVSTQAQETKTALSPCVDTVFYVKDASWGGLVPGTRRLSPTSTAMVNVSDRVVAIGGGEVSRDEFQAARRIGKKVEFFPADMNHALAVEKAKKRGQPAPTDFRSALEINK
jgi:hypothetical protein